MKNKELSANTNLSHYRILSKIGAGGMGKVFLAEDTKLNRKVALKILPENIASDNDHLRRFEQEARAASALNHPNILTIYEIGEFENLHFIATEFIEGETLREWLNRERLTIEEALDIAIQVTSALSAAHEAGIIHRDIKPENIMLRRDRLVKVLDFGLAKLAEKRVAAIDTEGETRALVKTEPGMILGTVNYMSPEQARGKETDPRSDIWSLGCVMYEMIAGRTPFDGETTADRIASIIHKEPLPLLRLAENVPARLEEIVSKCLEKDRDERYQTIKDLLIDLRRLKRKLDFQSEMERSVAPNNLEITGDQSSNQTQAFSVAQTDTAQSLKTTSSAEYAVNEIKSHKVGFAIGLIVLLFASIGLGYWFLANRSLNTKQIESIAVLPFENGSGNADLDYLSDGVSESVIDRLSQLGQLKVIARSSSFRYRGQNLNLQEIANSLGVDAIVTGRVMSRGDSYQIRVELVDVRENKQLWGETFNRKVSDVQILQTDISREIAENLRLRLSGAEQQQLASQGTTSPQAYELLLKGRFYYNKAGNNFDKAVEYYEQAVAADPNYALAWAELAEGYRQSGSRVLDRTQHQIKREAAAQRALQLNPNLAEAHSASADLKRDAWQWQEAETEYKRAIELNPNFDRAHVGYALYLSIMKRHDEAIAEIKRAREISPLSLIINASVGSIFLYARRYDEAIEAMKKRLELEQNLPLPYYRLGMIYDAKGMYAEAVANYQQAIRLVGNDRTWSIDEARLGAIYAKMGERDKAEEILQKIKNNQSNTFVSRRVLAILYEALGMRDEALAELEKSYAERNDPTLPYIAVEPAYDNLRSDPQFQDLLRRMGLPQ